MLPQPSASVCKYFYFYYTDLPAGKYTHTYLYCMMYCPPGGSGVPPYMGYIGMCEPKGYGFLAVLVVNRVSILAILVINWVWFLYLMGMLLRRSHFFIIMEKKIKKALHKLCLQ